MLKMIEELFCIKLLQFMSSAYTYCKQTQVQLLTSHKPIIQEARIRRKKKTHFNQKSKKSGEIVDLSPGTNSKDCSVMTDLKGKKKKAKNLNDSSRQEVVSASLSIECRPADSFQDVACVICLQDCHGGGWDRKLVIF